MVLMTITTQLVITAVKQQEVLLQLADLNWTVLQHVSCC